MCLIKFLIKFLINFKGHLYQSTGSKFLKLTPKECETMVNTKMCGSEKMDCSGSTCWYTPEIVSSYAWPRTITVDSYSCQITPRVITRKNID